MYLPSDNSIIDNVNAQISRSHDEIENDINEMQFEQALERDRYSVPNILPIGITRNKLDVIKERELYDPYVGFGLIPPYNAISVNKPRYTVNYINIDSSNRNKHTTVKTKCSVKLDSNPLSFNGQFLRINIDDTDQFCINDKIIINGVAEKEITLRSIINDDFGNDVNYFLLEKGKQYMTVLADNNMQINTKFTTELIDIYSNLEIDFKGFAGDKKTEWYFDTKMFIWDITPCSIINRDLESQSTYKVKITEDVLGITKSSFNHSEKHHKKQYMLIAEFVVDLYGTVIEINSDIPYKCDDICWIKPNIDSDKDRVKHKIKGIPDIYYTEVEYALSLASLDTPPKVPTTIYKIIEYFDKVQNVIRPIFLQIMTEHVNNFIQCYKHAKKVYPITCRMAVPEATKISNTSMIGNIPLNSLNSQHQMYLTSSDVQRSIGNDNSSSNINELMSNKFYVKLDTPYIKKRFEFSNPFNSGALSIKVYENTISDITIRYKHIGGIHLNMINSDYQTGFNTIDSFKHIKDIVKVSDICHNSYIIVELDRIGFHNKNFGGDNVYVSLINNIESCYPNPNKYTIDLEKMYTNIASIRMISSCFPKTQTQIMDGREGGKRNNRFYWQNIDDGDMIYSIEMGSGNYTHKKFKEEFEHKVNKVIRINDNIPCGSNHILLDINNKTELVTFTSYNKYTPNTNSVIFVDATSLSVLQSNILGSTDSDNAYYQYPSGDFFKLFPNTDINAELIRIKIYHPNNNVNVNDRILIMNSLNFGAIPAEYLNREHIVTRTSLDYYDIILSNINFDTTLDELCNDEDGGNEIVIYTPNRFRIRFDYQDTFGKILGFRNVGECTSITPYCNVITNDTLYENEYISNKIIKHKSLQFETPQYILMDCCQIPPSSKAKSLGKIKDYFYKINLCGKQNTYIFNSYVKSPIIFTDPLRELSELSIDIYAPDGSYYDFNGKNHSFVLEIVTYNELPEGTCIGS